MKLAAISDQDGYTNVREGKGSDTDIIGQIKASEIIRVVPSSTSDWWLVFFTKNEEYGYVHKSRIVTYENLDYSLQVKTRATEVSDLIYKSVKILESIDY